MQYIFKTLLVNILVGWDSQNGDPCHSLIETSPPPLFSYRRDDRRRGLVLIRLARGTTGVVQSMIKIPSCLKGRKRRATTKILVLQRQRNKMFIIIAFLLQIESVSSMSLKATEYMSTLDADSHVSLYIMATVKETSQVYIKREIYRVEQPNLELKVGLNWCVG